MVEAAVTTAGGRFIKVDDVPAGIRGNLGSAYLPPAAELPMPLDELLTSVERKLIEQSLVRARDNKSRAAEILGISRPRLYRRIKELGIEDREEPGDDHRPSS